MLQTIKAERVFMNTQIKISVISDKGTVYTHGKINDAFDQFDYVVKKFTRFDSLSELSKLNTSSGKAFVVSPELYKLVSYAIDIANKTDGAFDPTVIDLLEAYGYDKESNYSQLDNPKLMERIKHISSTRPSFKGIIFNESNSTITLKKGQRIDLGSIGKGYAIDLAKKALEEFDSFIINAGGDVYAKGNSKEGKPWKIGLYKTPLPGKERSKEDMFGAVELKNQCIAGSGGWARRVKFFHHLLNPKTGLPINNVSQTYVIANNAMDADSWATALFTMGESGLKLLKKNGFEGIIVNSSGAINKTS